LAYLHLTLVTLTNYLLKYLAMFVKIICKNIRHCWPKKKSLLTQKGIVLDKKMVYTLTSSEAVL